MVKFTLVVAAALSAAPATAAVEVVDLFVQSRTIAEDGVEQTERVAAADSIATAASLSGTSPTFDWNATASTVFTDASNGVFSASHSATRAADGQGFGPGFIVGRVNYSFNLTTRSRFSYTYDFALAKDFDTPRPINALNILARASSITVLDIEADNESGGAFIDLAPGLYDFFVGSYVFLGEDVSGSQPFNTAGSAIVSFSFTELAPVPEPASWAMMILGFGVVGAAARTVRYTARGRQSKRPSLQ